MWCRVSFNIVLKNKLRKITLKCTIRHKTLSPAGGGVAVLTEDYIYKYNIKRNFLDMSTVPSVPVDHLNPSPSSSYKRCRKGVYIFRGAAGDTWL